MVGSILACLFGSLILETSLYAGSKGKTNVQLLAQQIDALERHLELYGTISAKTPDVWSEERLTQHRFEYEQEMARELSRFNPALQATIRRADLAFLASATAIESAMGASGGTDARSLLGVTRIEQTISLPEAGSQNFEKFVPASDGKDGQIGVEPVLLLDQRSRYLKHLHNLRRTNQGDDTVDLPGYSLHLLRMPVGLLPGKKTQDGYGAELTLSAQPTLGEETLPIVFRELVIKDLLYQFAIPMTDTLNNSSFRAAVPVYQQVVNTCNEDKSPVCPIPWGNSDLLSRESTESCELFVRIERSLYRAMGLESENAEPSPVQVSLENLGIKSKDLISRVDAIAKGQILCPCPPDSTMSPKHPESGNKHESRKPPIDDGTGAEPDSTFPSMPLPPLPPSPTPSAPLVPGASSRRLIRDPEVQLVVEIRADQKAASQLRRMTGDFDLKPGEIREPLEFMPPPVFDFGGSLRSRGFIERSEIRLPPNIDNSPQPPTSNNPATPTPAFAPQAPIESPVQNYLPRSSNSHGSSSPSGNCPTSVAQASNQLRDQLTQSLGGALSRSLARFSRTTTRTSQIPFPLASFSAVYGKHMIIQVLVDAHNSIPGAIEHRATSFTDVERYLTDEIEAAYQFLELDARSEHPTMWKHSNAQLLRAVRECDYHTLECLRCAFYSELPKYLQNNTIGAFAWAIIVDATLLADRMRADFREVASQKNCPCLPMDLIDPQHPFPPLETRMAFNEYVRCRWPVRVFALDPETQDQNVGDSYSSRRELQLALAVGVSSGQISAENATRFARQLQIDIDTIALNRTAVAFSEGNDTFGWRFSPRVQTPPIEGNAKVIFRDLLLGGPRKDAVRRAHAIEPGPRECAVLVLTPSFIRQISLDVRSDWYDLGNSRRTGFTLEETMDLSRQVQCLKESAATCELEAHLYRDGEVYRLLKRVDQLAARLPLQTLHVEVPTRIKSHGFKMFAHGAMFDAGPTLYNWFGAPGIDLDQETTLFLLGENFTLSGIQVVAGNRELVARSPNSTPPSDSPAANAATATVPPSNAPQENSSSAKRGSFFLLSDQCMQITIPPDVMTFERRDGDGNLIQLAEIHVATCYGVSQSLQIPVISKKAEAAQAAAAAASQAAKGAVKEHVEALHVERFEFVSKLPAGLPNVLIVTVAPNQTIDLVEFEERFHLKPPQIQLPKDSQEVHGLLQEFQGGQVAFRVNAKPPAGNTLPVVASIIGPFDINANDSLDWEAVEETLTNSLRKTLPVGYPLDSVQLVGYVRAKSKEPGEIKRIGEPLEFQVQIIPASE
ncbi:hypothetical protein A6X21_04550 [Planctopirus hydrillae]|uniref:Uncharacterized protein n=2 Tax=Planctopirus hydrillae TaxID=1841610 RepID=A0A1C3ENW3_9PLAN|nr:hypothetical protein A6X21_04550 [Planctopirus hydrillae]